MILMPIIMIAPILALPLFYFLPMKAALPIYIAILISSAYCNVVMFWSMRARAKTGPEGMVGEYALVIKDIDPEGKVDFNGEIWTAIARDERIVTGQKVKIVEAKGLVLIVKVSEENKMRQNPHI